VSCVSCAGTAPVAATAPPAKAAQTAVQTALQSVVSTKPAPDGDTPAVARAERLNGGVAPKTGVNKIA
jgi:hypothetical protein